MQRHRNQEIRSASRKRLGADLGEEVAEWRGQRAAAAELEGVHRRSRDLAVLGRRPRIGERRPPAPALSAERGLRPTGTVHRLEPKEGKAACPAVRADDALDSLPTGSTEGVPTALTEALATDRTERREYQIQERSGPALPAGKGGRAGRYGRDVFQRRHDGQRSTQRAWLTPHAEQWCGHSTASGKPSARRYSSSASRVCPRRSKTAPR
jgi:hypothetical protein